MADDDHSDLPRKRQLSAEATAGRDAAVFVRELNRRLGYWQATSIKLHAIAGRLKAVGRTDPAVVEEAHALFHVVAAEALRFESLLPDQPTSVVQHGRIGDTRRSFEMVTERLRQSLELLGSEPRKPDRSGVDGHNPLS